ncbi:iron ABC transporter permease [Candidatus Symbiopectobacterium sp. NZEC151]|uniref:ABC transporter permease n=2 Tax=unclassified Symbiopectobacterium TaxID=2794573 RepID=UPI0022268089|nr:iron ABC transporter permease [Candidatus Symbiopectobacterium sp. NZEC151]MCW2474344.1 iron ABC transporter permease [Candidatus Symbiopectobacterium sp. NZEC151]
MRGFALLPLVTVAILFVLVGIPVIFVVLQAVFPGLEEGSMREPLSAFIAVAQDPRLGPLLSNTFGIGIGVALLSGLLGVTLGTLRGLFHIPYARVWDLLFLIPFLIPPYISALSWMLALQTRGYLEQLFSFKFNALLFSLPGMAIVMALNIFPVVYFAVSRSMASHGGRLADVARVHGAGPWAAFFRITLPLALPAIAASTLLAFALAIEEYGVPAAIGPHAGIQALTTGIEQRLADWPIDLSGAAVLSLLLVALALTAYTVQRALTAGKDVGTITGKPAAIVIRDPGRWTLPIIGLFSCVAVIAVGIPVSAMLATAFSGTLSGGLSADNVTLRHFSAVLSGKNQALSALSSSMGLASGTALLTGVVGTLVAWLVTVRRVRGAALLDGLSLLPVALPGIVVGLGLILAWNRSFWPITPYNTWAILLLAYSCLLLPYPIRYVSAALRQLGPNLEAAARVHGASTLKALRYVVAPLIFPSLLAAMLLVFAVAVRELVTSLLLAPAGVQTTAIFIWRQFEQGSVGQGMAMATVAMTVSLVTMLLGIHLYQRFQQGE